MSPPTNILEDRLCSWLSGWLTKQRLPTSFQVTPLAGDGSPRPFYRIRVGEEKDPKKTFVLLSEPAWTLSKDYPAHQAYLQEQGLPVPEFLAVDPSLGVLLMEDLGDELLQARLLAHPEEREDWLDEAACLLARLHGSTFPVPRHLPVASRAFDANKFQEELNFTLENLHEKLLGFPADPTLIGKARGFCGQLGSFEPRVFSHRDYHTRNLLVHEGEIRLIDFQDARMGPIEYDLASLFFDPYVPMTPAERARLTDLYRQELSDYPLTKFIDWKELGHRVDLVGFQRVVKAAGSFASFYTRYGKRTHFPYLLPALETAQRLQKILGTEVPSYPLESWIRKIQEGLP